MQLIHSSISAYYKRDKGMSLFISHSHEDDTIVNKICNFLEENDLKCWMDDRNALSRKLWEVSIVRALKSTKLVISLSFRYKIPVFPIKLDDTSPNEKFEFYLTDVQWFDAINLPIESCIKTTKCTKTLRLVRKVL